MTLVQASNKQLESRKMAMVAASPLWKELKYRGGIITWNNLGRVASSLNSAVKQATGTGLKAAKTGFKALKSSGAVVASGAGKVGKRLSGPTQRTMVGLESTPQPVTQVDPKVIELYNLIRHLNPDGMDLRHLDEMIYNSDYKPINIYSLNVIKIYILYQELNEVEKNQFKQHIIESSQNRAQNRRQE